MANDKDEIGRGIELLVLCQQLQSEKDGIVRPEPGEHDKTKTLDDFAVDVDRAISNMTLLRRLVPMMLQLDEIGRKLEASGQLSVRVGEDYSVAALKFLRGQYGLE